MTYCVHVHFKNVYVHVTWTLPSVQVIFSGVLFINFADIFDPPAHQDCPPHEKLLAIIHKAIPTNKNTVEPRISIKVKKIISVLTNKLQFINLKVRSKTFNKGSLASALFSYLDLMFWFCINYSISLL